VSVSKPPALSAEAVKLSEYIAGALAVELPASVAAKARAHVLDTLAAMLSGSRLPAGRLAAAYVGREGGAAQACVAGTSVLVPAEAAALANGMAAHADETDDSHLGGRFHPGCGIVPAALAVAELQDRGGADFLRAVALGYDFGARLTMALYPGKKLAKHSTHSLGPAFGAAAASACLLRLDAQHVRFALSYAVQQLSGIPYWQRDTEHVEKAFDFGGLTGRNGVTAAKLAAAGFSAVEDPFSGRDNVFTAFGDNPDPPQLTAELGARFEIMHASIKKWCVGSPIQAMLDAVTALIETHKVKAADVQRVVIIMPSDRFHIVDNRPMPDICAQHLVALALVDGGITFASAHDDGRMDDGAVRAVRDRTELVPNEELTAAVPARQAIVEIETRSGARLRHHAKAVRGTPDNPMTMVEVEDKARDLIAPIIGRDCAERLIATVGRIESVRSMRELRPLLQV
jgi:2-methylcitrate dehydratase PrpD